MKMKMNGCIVLCFLICMAVSMSQSFQKHSDNADNQDNLGSKATKKRQFEMEEADNVPISREITGGGGHFGGHGGGHAVSGGGGCFPGSAMVITPTGNVTMEMLKLGDSVLTVLDNKELGFTKVVAFGERRPNKQAYFLSITAVNQAGENRTVNLTATHIIYAKSIMADDPHKFLPRYAEEVIDGDKIIILSNNGTATEEAKVINVTMHMEKGVYNPVTETGTMLVDGTLVSCYASFKHRISHLATAPLRWFPWLFVDEEPLDGTLPFVASLKYIVRSYVTPIVPRY